MFISTRIKMMCVKFLTLKMPVVCTEVATILAILARVYCEVHGLIGCTLTPDIVMMKDMTMVSY